MKQLGSGSISDAFLCMDKKCNAIFCLKRYHKATIKNFPEVLDNFIKKVAFQFLAQDPNIIQLYDIFCDGQFIYTIQQYMQSGKLSQNIQKEVELRQQKRRQTQNFTNTTTKQQEEPLFNQSKIIDKIYDINSALCYIHQSYDSTPKIGKKKMPPLVHGDVRTKSILVSMGVCKLPAIEPANIKSYYINSYSPPEQIIEQVYITKSDIWNLGLILFELCAERKLFGHENQGEHSEDDNKPGYQVFNVNITQEIDKLSGTTQLLKDLMKKLLAIQPEDRPSSSKVMESHVFRMYGFDVEWKQRRNEKIMKIKDMKEMDKDRYKKHSISLQELKLESEVYSKKQAQFINTLGKNSINLNLSRDLNCTHESNEVTESTPPTKTYWTGKSRLSAEKKY